MTELEEKVLEMLHKYLDAGGSDDLILIARNDWERNLKAQGWIHLPNAEGRNVTVFTHDSENERFMTFDEWAEEALAKGWQRGTA